MLRHDKVTQAIKKEISNIIHDELKDPRLGFVTITRVEMTADLRYAKVFFSVLGKEEEHKKALRGWFQWVNEHRELFKEWKSVRYFEKTVAGEESGRHLMMWEYESMADFEAYKKRRANYTGPYEEYKKNDPYHMGVFQHKSQTLFGVMGI